MAGAWSACSSDVIMARTASEAHRSLLTCIDRLYATKTLQIGRSGDRLFASSVDDARRDALKSVSRVAAQVGTKSAEKLSQIASASSSDPGDLPSKDSGLAVSLARPIPPCSEQQDFFYRGGSERRCRRHTYKADI